MRPPEVKLPVFGYKSGHGELFLGKNPERSTKGKPAAALPETT